eukprot:10787770-Alexandrium_andersonii.AAC.1
MDGYMYVVFGGAGKMELAGVGFNIDMRLRRATRLIDSQGSRIAMLSLKTGPRAINLFSVYAPQAARLLIERQGYYEDFDKIM